LSARVGAVVVAGLLAIAGTVLVGLRIHYRQDVQMSRGDQFWRLAYTVEFRAAKAGAKLRAAFPTDTHYGRVFQEELHYPGLTPVRTRPARPETREVNLLTQAPGGFLMTAHFDIHLAPRTKPASPPIVKEPTAQLRAELLRSVPKSIQADNSQVVEALKRLREGAANETEILKRIYDHCRKEIVPGDLDAPSDAAAAIERGTGTPLGRSRAMVALCRAAKIPARIVTGFKLSEGDDVAPHYWIEAFTNHHWEPFDPVDGFEGELSAEYMPTRRDDLDIVQGTDVEGLHTTYATERIPPPPGVVPPGRQNPVDILDLWRLPLEMHEVLKLVLLIPLGALLTAIVRTIIGIRTFGTFTPTLLALSFVHTDWHVGLMVFAAVMVLGLTSRTFLDRLQLLLVPRLSTVLTLVVLIIVFGVSILEFYHRTPDARSVLLPMVILTMTIERFYVTSEEDSMRFAIQLMIATIAVAVCCYLVLRWDQVGEILLKYPELHLFTIAVLILMGRYTGYRLSELWRFRDFSSHHTLDQ
jgi:hypothetical protein